MDDWRYYLATGDDEPEDDGGYGDCFADAAAEYTD